jgi:oligopeptide/dipeptide ABC transporter ATP-binding protein
MSEPLLAVRDLCVHFPARRGKGPPVRAVDGVTFELERGSALGLVGESGCGKTTTAHSLLGLHRPESGSIRLEGRELTGLTQQEWKGVRRRIQIVFQDSLASLDPRQTVGRSVREPLDVHAVGTPRERRMRVLALLDAVGLATLHHDRYPHELSGGQCQRVAIARALALEPEVLICDEPVSSLDVSIQAQLVNLLNELTERFALSMLFVSHDLGVVRQVCDRVAVMYLGRVVELASRDPLFEAPRHPYTRALLSAVPQPDPNVERNRARTLLEGEVPSPSNPPPGCRFHPRCKSRVDVRDDLCAKAEPELLALPFDPPRSCACHLVAAEFGL